MPNRPSILVLDDDVSACELLQDALWEDYQVYPASNALDAADLLHLQRVDLLIVDLHLPILDGVQFIRLVRDEPHLRQMPILAVTAYPEFIRHLDGTHVEALLRKPFDLLDLQLTVKELIAGPTLWDHLKHADGGWMEREVLLLYTCHVRHEILSSHQRLSQRIGKSRALLRWAKSWQRSSRHLLQASAYRLGVST